MKASLSNSGTIDITELDSETKEYQAIDVLEFSADTMATGVIIDEFDFQGNFKAIDINVLSNNAPIKAELEKPDGYTWIIRLPRAMSLKRINIQEFQILHVGMAVDVIATGALDFLLEESQLSVGAALVVDNKIERVTEVVDTQLRLGNKVAINAQTLDIFPVIGDKIIEQSIATITNNGVINNLNLEAFAIRGNNFSHFSSLNLLLNNHQISVYVESQPQGLSLGLAPVLNDLPELEKLVELSGFNLQSNQDIVPLENNASVWLKGMQTYMDENFITHADNNGFKVALVIRSENPCEFKLTQFNNSYRLLFKDLEMFPDIDAADPDSPQEQKISFTGTHWQNYVYQLSLPADSVLQSAVLPYKDTLSKKAFSFTAELPTEQWLATASGVELTNNQWAGGTFQLDSAQSVRYLVVPLMASAAQTVCSLEIREDINDYPSGAIITEQSLVLAEEGTRSWMVVALDESLALFSKKLWWLVKTTQGSAVQFALASLTGSGISHFSLSESGGPGSVFRFTGDVNVTPLFAKDSTDGFKLHAFLGDEESGLQVESFELPDSNLQHFDLLPALSADHSPEPTQIDFRIASLLKGNAVLYPVEISYELAE